ncbi:hypothetical protein [Phytoactinopolyspora endophytica]|uniref:hypothetical protein n=1 Tax=Phytoactinopolyspora endophytica TaxID=1642495 RepID=UPI00101B7017|nr:hypothetical protein [Phytoactinopolyspora endophytica]
MNEPLLFDVVMDSTWAMDSRTGPGRRFEHGLLWPAVREVERYKRPFEDLALIDRLQFGLMTELLKTQPNNYLGPSHV